MLQEGGSGGDGGSAAAGAGVTAAPPRRVRPPEATAAPPRRVRPALGGSWAERPRSLEVGPPHLAQPTRPGPVGMKRLEKEGEVEGHCLMVAWGAGGVGAGPGPVVSRVAGLSSSGGGGGSRSSLTSDREPAANQRSKIIM